MFWAGERSRLRKWSGHKSWIILPVCGLTPFFPFPYQSATDSIVFLYDIRAQAARPSMVTDTCSPIGAHAGISARMTLPFTSIVTARRAP